MRTLLALLFCLGANLAFAQNSNLNFLGKRTYNNDLSDVWGYAANGKEYALVGVYNGVSIVDVTNPAQPVQLFFVPGQNTYWRDIATWNGYAYVTNEAGGGLLIINLNYLPDSIQTNSWTGGSLGLNTAHTVFTDENGIIYIAGANQNAGRGAIMLNPNSSPTNPTLLGKYNQRYVHDVFVRGDTMWSCEINDGIFSVVDVSVKGSPSVMATNSTPSNSTHNAWLSQNGKYLLTTDEVSNAYIASYDVSDLSNIKLLDLFQSSPGTNVIPHNVHYVGDYAVASYYRDGVVIIDASNPSNLIKVGNYDTSPLSGSGFNGVWSIYPYLPSGNILASDIEEGLFILAPVYERACYLEGTVTDITSSQAVNNVSVIILPSNPADNTNLLGQYKTGIGDSGTYSVQFVKSGYQTHTEHNVILKNGQVTTLNVQLIPAIPIALNGSVVDVANGQGIQFAEVLFKSLTNSYQATADPNGNFGIQNFETGSYEVFAGKWGYLTKVQNVVVFPGTTVVVGLQKGYYDDFLFDLGWTETSNASSGDWERGLPDGTFFSTRASNPAQDVSADFGEECYVTGNGGGQAGNDDVDDGRVTLISPVFDLSAYDNPYISYYRWYFNDGGNGPIDDTFFVKISNGTDEVVVETITGTSSSNQWTLNEFRVMDFITPTAFMAVSFETNDESATGHLVEAAVDVFSVKDSNSVQLPVVDFTSDINSGCPGSSFIFTDLSANQPDTRFWEFPGGSPPSSTDASPAVIYANPGIYSVTLSATNLAGTASSTKQSYILIYDLPAVTASITNETSSGSSNGSIQLAISGNGSSFSILWDNGSTSALLGNLGAGIYPVTVTDGNGCEKRDTFTVGIGTSLGSIHSKEVQVYPNPFRNKITIKTNKIFTELSFYNSNGMESGRLRLNSEAAVQWGEGQPAGVYFMVLKSEKSMSVIKLIKLE